MASIDAACKLPDEQVRNTWIAMLHVVCKNVGIEELLATRWSNGQPLTSGDGEIIALIEAAMKELPPTSTASGSRTTNTAAGTEAPHSTAQSHVEARNDPPLPLTPFSKLSPNDDEDEEESSS